MFDKARIKLTAWYLLILMLVSISFSLVIYRVSTQELDRFSRLQRMRIERHFETRVPAPAARIFIDPELIEETRRRIITFLALVNLVILATSGGFAYFLAGKTLMPIKDMIDEQNRFISDASHEFKTPLTSLKAALEVNLRDTHLTLKDAKLLIKENIEEVNKLQYLTEGLLQLTSYERLNGHTKFEKVSLSAVIKRSIQEIKNQANAHGVLIKDESRDVRFKGDQRELIDLLVILLDNAVKYSPRGKTVTISSQKIDKSILIKVSDQGIGIDEKDLSHVFDRFYRTDMARKKDEIGSYGLGLSIAKKIVEVHKGSINAESVVGKGSTFTVRLPFS